VSLKIFALIYHLLLELKEYQLLYTIILASVFFIDLNIIIRAPIFYSYRTILYYNNFNIHSDLLIERIFLIFE
jgi:hypothetical protein